MCFDERLLELASSAVILRKKSGKVLCVPVSILKRS